jgi:hypothetical protein
MPPATAHFPDHDRTGVDAKAHRELHAIVGLQARIQSRHSVHNLQTGVDRPQCIVFMGLGIAKVDQQAIAEILGDMPFVALDNSSGGRLIGTHHLAQVFGIELVGEDSRVHQVAEHHGQLSAFCCRGRASRRWDGPIGRNICSHGGSRRGRLGV